MLFYDAESKMCYIGGLDHPRCPSQLNVFSAYVIEQSDTFSRPENRIS